MPVSMPSTSESDPNLDYSCDDDLNKTNKNHDMTSTDVMNAEASNGHLEETNNLGNVSISLADLDLSSDTLNEDTGASRGSPYRNDSNESLTAILPPNQIPKQKNQNSA